MRNSSRGYSFLLHCPSGDDLQSFMELNMSGWTCPYYTEQECLKVHGKQCEPGMKGCVLTRKLNKHREEKSVWAPSSPLEEKQVMNESSIRALYGTRKSRKTNQ